VIDTTANLEKTARLVELFDSEVFRAAGMKLFKLKVLDPEEMAKNLEKHLRCPGLLRPGREAVRDQLRPDPSAVLPAGGERVSEDDGGRGEVDRGAGPRGGGASRSVYRYRVKYGKVKDVAAVLERLYPSRTAPVAAEKRTEFKPAVGAAMPGQSSGFPSQPPAAGQPAAMAGQAVARTAKGRPRYPRSRSTSSRTRRRTR